MAEAAGVVASVIAIAGLAYHGSKKLYEALDSYQNAPKTLSNLRTELDIVQQLLHSIGKKPGKHQRRRSTRGIAAMLA
jgi:hypothetical protein